ncbi:lamin tail domain-containing protein 2 [Camelus ferus]|uniref:Lamin tail domain-containing protein 2 n=1 Tax=Camelus ferus TaxID=419612 RepID=A0A8B8TVD1_CAMFR|nr:lamin tail domain-containing protein 2 [Camelus ferus]
MPPSLMSLSPRQEALASVQRSSGATASPPPVRPRLAPESLDPHTLRLLWGQRELEIQALRWAIQNPRNGRHYHILREVAGLPPERSSRSQEKFLQNQVQKLTLQLKGQKEQAQLEKARLEERLLQMRNTLQQMEAELQALRKSCLLQLARSSWVGRILRSSTGSVEVVTAETLMDPSDLSESDQAPTAGESFRLEDVDWNSIAHQYPNLFTNIESNSDQKRPWAPPPPQLPPATLSDQRSSELCCRRREQRLKSVQWSSLPLVGTSSSGSTGSESSSCQLAACNCVQKVTGDHPQAPGCTSEQMEAQAWSLCEDSQAISEASYVSASVSHHGPAIPPAQDLTPQHCSSAAWTLRVLQARCGLTGDVPSGCSIGAVPLPLPDRPSLCRSPENPLGPAGQDSPGAGVQ